MMPLADMPNTTSRSKGVLALFLRWLGTNRLILENAGALISTTGVTSVLGLGFWWVAADMFSSSSVGLAWVSISVMTLLGQAGVVGVDNVLISSLRLSSGRGPALVATTLLIAATMGSVLACLFLFTLPHVLISLRPLWASPVTGVIFVLGVGLSSAANVADAAGLAVLRASLQLRRNIILAVTKLLVLIAVGTLWSTHHWLTIYLSWVIGLALSLAGVYMMTVQPRWSLANCRPSLELLQNRVRQALTNYLLNLCFQVTYLVLPLVVTVALSTSANAYFGTAWQIAGFASITLTSISAVLYAVSASDQEVLARTIHTTLRLSLALAVLSVCVVLPGAYWILAIFGHSYAAGGAWSLRLFALALFPLIIRTHFMTICRVNQQALRAALFMAIGGSLELVAAAIGGMHGGLTGLSIGWLVVVCLESLMMAPTVYRCAFPRHSKACRVH